jgi:hypothetical protein
MLGVILGPWPVPAAHHHDSGQPRRCHPRSFVIGPMLIAIGFLATLFLREIPLRNSNRGA